MAAPSTCLPGAGGHAGRRRWSSYASCRCTAGPDFSPGFWAFTFSYAAAAGDAITWLRVSAAPGRTGLTIAVLALITGLVGVIAVRTIRLAQRGQLLPAPASPAAPSPAPAVTGGQPAS